jgi:hypothetical protein
MEAGAVYVAPRCRGAADVVGRTKGADCCTSIGTGGAGRASRPLYVAIGYDALEEGAMCSDVVGPGCECVVPVSSTRGEVCERADHVAPVAGCGVCRAEGGTRASVEIGIAGSIPGRAEDDGVTATVFVRRRETEGVTAPRGGSSTESWKGNSTPSWSSIPGDRNSRFEERLGVVISSGSCRS